MHINGSRADYGFMSLADLIPYAYGAQRVSTVGTGVDDRNAMDILAKIPAGQSADRASPDVRFNERIRIAGRLIDDEDLAGFLSEVLDASAGSNPASSRSRPPWRSSPLRAHPRRLYPGGRAWREAGRDERGRASAGHRDRQPRARSSAFPGPRPDRHRGEKAGIAKRDVPLVTQITRPASPAKSARSRQRRAPSGWLEAIWDAISTRASSTTRRGRRARTAVAEPRGNHQGMNAGLAVAMLRHQQDLSVPPMRWPEGASPRTGRPAPAPRTRPVCGEATRTGCG